MRLNVYALSSPPTGANLGNYSRKDTNEFFEWFAGKSPERISLLEKTIRANNSPSWRADSSPMSLEGLGAWLSTHVDTREYTDADRKWFYENAPQWFVETIAAPTSKLDIQTESLVLDIAMYLSTVLQTNIAGFRLKLCTSPKSSVNYQWPVLWHEATGAECNPIGMSRVVALKFKDGEAAPQELKRVFDVWKKLAEPKA